MKSDIPARTFEFAKRVVRLCRQLDGAPGVPRTLSGQLLRSGTSICANVVEGQSSQSVRNFVHKYSIACKEARETLYWLRLLAASGITAPEHLTELQKECNELIAILTCITKKMRREA